MATFEPESGFACLIEHHRYLAALWHGGGRTLTALFGGGRAPCSGLALALLAGLGCGAYYSRRRLWLVYGLGSPGASAVFYRRNPWRQVILVGLAGSILITSMPTVAYAGTPVYDPVFYYYHADHLGSSQLLTDRDGDVVQQYGYTPFGRENYRNNTQAFSISQRYTGQTLDEDTGLYYYGARYYDPELARFIQADSLVPDPGDSQAYNRYAYVYNNPLKFTDPTGHVPASWWSMMWTAFVGAALGAMQAGWTGDRMLMGAYLGAINAINNTYFVNENNASTALNSMLTGNAGTSEGSTPFSGSGTSDPEDFFVPETNKIKDTDLKPILKEAAHAVLDAIGTVEPVPVADTINVAWYAAEGRIWDAASSAAGMASYFGDIAKAGRYGAKAVDYSSSLRLGLAGESLGRSAGRAVGPYDVGIYHTLEGMSRKGDRISIHHVGQAHLFEQLIPGYSRRTAPAIAIPYEYHLQIPNFRGTTSLTARQVLANDVWNLKKYAGAPNSSLRELIELNIQTYPGAFTK